MSAVLETATTEEEARRQGVDPDVLWALAEFKRRQANYALFRDYYDGRHRAVVAVEDYGKAFRNLLRERRINICPAVVAALTDRLTVEGFEEHRARLPQLRERRRPPDVGIDDNEAAADGAPLADAATALWEDRRLERVADEVHTEAVALGDAYVLVWPDDTGRAQFYAEPAERVVVRYHQERRGELTLAAKLWPEGGRYYLTVYTDRDIRKYQARQKTSAVPGVRSFVAREVEGEAWPVAHRYGRVPWVPFSFEGGIGRPGRAILVDIITIQDSINKAVADRTVAQEFAAWPQRWAVGVEAGEDDFKVALNRILTVSAPDAKLGEFSATRIEAYNAVIDADLTAACVVTGTPPHYFHQRMADPPSGESLKVAEARLVKRIENAHAGFGDAWEQVVTLGLVVEGLLPPGAEEVQLAAVWQNPASRAEKEEAETAGIKVNQVGVPRERAWAELGYSEREIAEMRGQADGERAGGLEAFQREFGAGRIGGNGVAGPRQPV